MKLRIFNKSFQILKGSGKEKGIIYKYFISVYKSRVKKKQL